MSLPPESDATCAALWLRIESQLSNVVLVGTAIDGICRYAGMDETTAYQVRLCATEALNNAIEHAYQLATMQPVEVEISLTSGAIRIEIVDCGKPIPPDALDAACDWSLASDEIESLPTRGMGLFLIHTIMDSVEYRKDGSANRLMMTKTIAPTV